VAAYLDWIHNCGITQGPVFRSINRWGRVSDKALHVDSIVSILRELFHSAEEDTETWAKLKLIAP
tara:strand:+ start:46752 stop:46946 length:195 start_codon:yes stop_codon:yes gene_type:complete